MIPQAGNVGYCSKGILGVLIEKKELPYGESWVGISLRGGELWASREPQIQWDSLKDYMTTLEATLEVK